MDPWPDMALTAIVKQGDAVCGQKSRPVRVVIEQGKAAAAMFQYRSKVHGQKPAQGPWPDKNNMHGMGASVRSGGSLRQELLI
jgi:hypothetical protein